MVSNAPVLKFYDVNKAVTLSVDASSVGLGAVIMQNEQPVAYGSRSLTDTQKRYAQIEKELLAIVYGCERFKQYLYGKQVQVESDHKPLESMFKKRLHKAPTRLQRMLMRLQAFDLRVTYKPGKDSATAEDSELQLVMKAVQSGWPVQVSQVPAEKNKYWTFREELSCF